jgi:hypothetical protein
MITIALPSRNILLPRLEFPTWLRGLRDPKDEHVARMPQVAAGGIHGGLNAGAVGVASAATIPLLLDKVTSAAAAYSLRKLRTDYAGAAVRVRRSTDNAEQDIGFSGNDFDASAFSSFIGAGSGYAKTFYDQSGNGRDLSQSTTANQPQFFLNVVNGKPVLRGDGSNDSIYAAIVGTLDTGTHKPQSGDAYAVVNNGTYGNSALQTLIAALPSAASIATAVWAAGTRTLTGFGTLVADIWAYATRTLTQSAASVAAALSGSDITILRGDTVSVTLTGLGNISARTALYFTVKENVNGGADSDARIQVTESGGLVVLNGSASGLTASDASVTVTNANTGALTLLLKPNLTKQLAAQENLRYDIQMVTATGVTTLTEGDCAIAADVTRAVS